MASRCAALCRSTRSASGSFLVRTLNAPPLVQRPGQVDDLPVHGARDGGLREARADGLRDVAGRRPRRDRSMGSVGEYEVEHRGGHREISWNEGVRET